MGKTDYKKTVFACYRGYITQAIIVNLTPLFFVIFQDEYNVSFVALGSIVLLNFVTQLLTDAVSISFIGKVGYRAAAVMAHAFAAGGLVLLGVLPELMPLIPALVISTIIFAVGGGLLEVLVSPIIDSLPGGAKESSMSLLHSFFCWGQVAVILITTLILFLIGNEKWNIIPVLWAVLPVYNLIAFLKVPLIPPASESERTPVKTLINSKAFLLLLLLMSCAGAAELAMSQWASLFTEKALMVSKATGDIFGPCLFGVMMGIGRTLYGIYGSRVRMTRVLALSSVLCVASYLLTALMQNAVIALAGCALCGLSVSLMWPGMISMAAGAFRKGGAAMFGMLALFGDIGCSLGPWLVGAVSELGSSAGHAASLRLGILAATAFPLVMLLGMILFSQAKKAKAD